MSEKEDWSTSDDKGIIHMPDYLDKLYNSIGMQLRFHTISGKNEMETIAHMVSLAEDFFREHYNHLSSPQAATEGWISVKDRLPEVSQHYFVYGRTKHKLPCYWISYCYKGKFTKFPRRKVTHWMPLPSPPALQTHQ